MRAILLGAAVSALIGCGSHLRLPAAVPTAAAPAVELPLAPNSVRFAVIGDSGTGGEDEYEVARDLAGVHAKFPFDFVLMLGDNLYGRESASDFERKFALPYAPLLQRGVKFYAALGNHDNPNERFYKPFNMGGKRYYSFSRGNAEFFALDSNYMDPDQLAWLERKLAHSHADWKICYFHHPLYSDARAHGPDRDLRAQLQPLFERYGVNVVFSGHEHVYERLKPQNGIYYFIEGSSGQLRYHNLRPSGEMARGFDTDRAFMLVEISGDRLYFQTISRTGNTVDSGVLARNAAPRRTRQGTTTSASTSASLSPLWTFAELRDPEALKRAKLPVAQSAAVTGPGRHANRHPGSISTTRSTRRPPSAGSGLSRCGPGERWPLG